VEAARSPIDRVERERDDLTRPQAVRGDEEQHGVVPEAVRGAAINRLQQTSDGRPRQAARELLLTIDARGIDRTMQARPNAAAGGQEAQKAAELRDPMLQRRAAEALADRADEGLYVRGRERGESFRPDLVLELGEELRSRGDVRPDGQGGQAPEVVERGAIDIGQHGDTRHGRRPGRQQGALLREAKQPAHGGTRVGMVRPIPPQARFEIDLPNALPLSMSAAPEITIDSDQRSRVSASRISAIPLLR